MKYLKEFNESSLLRNITDEVIEFHLSVPLYLGGKWTTFFSASKTYKVNGTSRDLDDLELRYYNIVWKKYEGIEMPYPDMEYGPTRPEFSRYPIELIDTLTEISKSIATDFTKSTNKKYVRGNRRDPNDYREREVDRFPEKEEISNISLKFSDLESANDWLDDLEYLLFE